MSASEHRVCWQTSRPESTFNPRKLLMLIDNSVVEYSYDNKTYWDSYKFCEENHAYIWAERLVDYYSPWAKRRRHEAVRIKLTLGRHIICQMQHLPLHFAEA